jgi:hypothetical protein
VTLRCEEAGQIGEVLAGRRGVRPKKLINENNPHFYWSPLEKLLTIESVREPHWLVFAGYEARPGCRHVLHTAGYFL